MLIKSFTIENFRQYKGKHKLDLAVDPGKNVTVILGSNANGKTTIVRAFAWCLYGGDTAESLGFKEKTNLLNENLCIALEEEQIETAVMSAEMVILMNHEVEPDRVDELSVSNSGQSVKYRIRRTFTFGRNQNQTGIRILEKDFVIFKEKGDENPEKVISTSRQRRIVNRIMPQDLSPYFFYWGENIEEIDRKSNIDKAVNTFLGLDIYTDALVHLKEVARIYDKKITNQIGNEEITDLEKKVSETKMKMDTCDLKKKEIEKNLEYYKDKIEKLETEFVQIRGFEESKEIEIRLLETIRETEQAEKDTYKEFIADFRKNRLPMYIVAQKARKTLEILKQDKDVAFGWSNLSVDGIDEILRRHVCICGRDLHDNEEAIAYLEEQKKYALPNSYSSLLEKFQQNYDFAQENATDYMNKLYADFKKIDKLRETIAEAKDQLEDIRKKLVGEEEYNRKKREIEDIQTERDEQLELLGKKKEEFKNLSKKYAKLCEDLEKAIEKYNKDNELAARRMLVKEVEKAVRQEKASLEEQLRRELQAYTQKYFDEMYHGNRQIEIQKNFKMKVINSVGDKKRENETSPGIEAVKNFAYIGALITIAKQIANEKSKGKLDMEPYPLVLDAPFSQVDEIHVAHICKMISQVADQTVFVIMEKDWKFAKDILENSVGAAYQLIKESETITGIEAKTV